MSANQKDNERIYAAWGGKRKAVTFSFDDGVTQDIRLIEMLNRYGLKSTFNLNSALLGATHTVEAYGARVRHDKVNPEEVAKIYAGHEVAAHTLTHPNLTEIADDAEIIRQVEEDRLRLSELCGYEVIGMAYPCGGVNNNDRVAEIIRANTGIQYSRTINCTGGFDMQENLLRFNPSAYYVQPELEGMIDRFLMENSDEPQLLYIWGHSYEMDTGYITWERFDALSKKLAGHSDIFYGTNREVFALE